MLPKDFDVLFREAGETLAREDEAFRAAQRERLRKRRERRRRLRVDRKRAVSVADDVWAWVVGEEADALRALMRSNGLEELRVLGWLRANGTRQQRPFSGAWQVRLLCEPGTILLFRVGVIAAGGLGTITERVECAAALARIAPPRVVFAIQSAIESRAVIDHVREELRFICRHRTFDQ